MMFLLPIHPGFGQTAAIVAGTSLPVHAPMLGGRHEMSVTLRYRCFVWNGGRSGWDYDRSFRMAFGHSIINGRAIIRAVGGHRSDAGIDLIEQLRDFRNIAHIV